MRVCFVTVARPAHKKNVLFGRVILNMIIGKTKQKKMALPQGKYVAYIHKTMLFVSEIASGEIYHERNLVHQQKTCLFNLKLTFPISCERLSAKTKRI